MRRVMWAAAVLGLLSTPAFVQAQERFGHAYSEGFAGPRGYGAPQGGVPPGFSNFGLRLRGGFGRNGYAPLWGPVWGPEAFMPAAGTDRDVRHYRSYGDPVTYSTPAGTAESDVGQPTPPIPSTKESTLSKDAPAPKAESLLKDVPAIPDVPMTNESPADASPKLK